MVNMNTNPFDTLNEGTYVDCAIEYYKDEKLFTLLPQWRNVTGIPDPIFKTNTFEEYEYREHCNKLPSEIIMPYTSAPHDLCNFFQLYIDNNGFSADMTITPVYSTPLTD
jgi:hypothetical protein